MLDYDTIAAIAEEKRPECHSRARRYGKKEVKILSVFSSDSFPIPVNPYSDIPDAFVAGGEPSPAAPFPEFLDDARADEGAHVSPPVVAQEIETPAAWLKRRLFAGPRQIGELVGEWTEPVMHPQSMTNSDCHALGDRITLLTDAGRALSVVVETNRYQKFTWRLP